MKNKVYLILFIFVFKSFTSWAQFPPVEVSGKYLVLNGSDKRWFFSGYVDNTQPSGMQLTKYNSAEMEAQMIELSNMKATGMRWNSFLKGLDFNWDTNGYVDGFYPQGDPLAALKDGLDLAHEYGLKVQLVLATTHFLNYGFGGADNVIAGRISNQERVDNNYKMLTTDEGIQAYLDNIIVPIANKLGLHPALAGYLIINEAYGMTDSRDTDRGAWTDQTARLIDLQKFVNRVASKLKDLQPGVLCSVSALPQVRAHYEDSALIAAGGKTNGVMDIYQYNYYHEWHKDKDSPFLNTRQELVDMFGGSDKPTICGEFFIAGGEPNWDLEKSYIELWENGYSGGWTWSSEEFDKQPEYTEAYTNFYDNYIDSSSTVVSVESTIAGKNITTDNQILLYPNPSNGEISLSLNNNVENIKIRILSVDGKTILLKNIRNTAQINLNLSGFPKGTYTIIMELNDSLIKKHFIMH